MRISDSATLGLAEVGSDQGYGDGETVVIQRNPLVIYRSGEGVAFRRVKPLNPEVDPMSRHALRGRGVGFVIVCRAGRDRDRDQEAADPVDEPRPVVHWMQETRAHLFSGFRKRSSMLDTIGSHSSPFYPGSANREIIHPGFAPSWPTIRNGPNEAGEVTSAEREETRQLRTHYLERS